MDTQDVIDLTCRAADNVLRFRTIAFQPRYVFDVKPFKTSITTNIRKIAKEDGNRFETPLAKVVTYAGVAASRAVQSWNNVSTENHVDQDWFRNCVCDLVSGVISDIGHKAFQHNDLNASEYLDPETYDPFDVTTYSTNRPRNSTTPSSDTTLAYYGFARRGASNHQSLPACDEDASAEQDNQQVPMRHEVNRGWKAIHKLAASREVMSATADFVDATTSLRRKRDSPSNNGDESSTVMEADKKRAKRPRVTSSSPAAAPSAAIRTDSVGDATDTRRQSVRVSWTKEEVDLMVKSREDGENWDFIHAHLPRHTRGACQKKYRDVVKQKEKQEQRPSADADVATKNFPSPGSGSQGDAEEDVPSEQDE